MIGASTLHRSTKTAVCSTAKIKVCNNLHGSSGELSGWKVSCTVYDSWHTLRKDKSSTVKSMSSTEIYLNRDFKLNDWSSRTLLALWLESLDHFYLTWEVYIAFKVLWHHLLDSSTSSCTHGFLDNKNSLDCTCW